MQTSKAVRSPANCLFKIFSSVTFGAKVTKTWGWDTPAKERRQPKSHRPPREQERLEGYLLRVKHPHTPERPIPSLEFADRKSAYRDTRMMGIRKL